MEALLLLLVLAVNVLISVWNCYAVGTAWKDTMAMGSTFNKAVLWSAVIHAGVGFSMPILLGLTWLAVTFLTSGAEPTITPAEGAELMRAIFDLWYVAIIIPILGSGFIIWAHSLRVAYERRDFASVATAGWNTYAQVSNTLSAVEHLGGSLGNVGEFFGSALSGKGDAKGKLALIGIMIVILSLVAGFMIAFSLIRHFARNSESRIEREYARA